MWEASAIGREAGAARPLSALEKHLPTRVSSMQGGQNRAGMVGCFRARRRAVGSSGIPAPVLDLRALCGGFLFCVSDLANVALSRPIDTAGA